MKSVGTGDKYKTVNLRSGNGCTKMYGAKAWELVRDQFDANGENFSALLCYELYFGIRMCMERS